MFTVGEMGFRRELTFHFVVCLEIEIEKYVYEMILPPSFLLLPLFILSLSPSLPVQANPNELTNGVINAAFMLLFKDSIRLFAAYNEGVINLLGKDRSRIRFNDSFLLSKGVGLIN